VTIHNQDPEGMQKMMMGNRRRTIHYDRTGRSVERNSWGLEEVVYKIQGILLRYLTS
jgi:hypothetical protein